MDEATKKPAGSPDAGAASMAYMPGADGKLEADNSDSQLKIDKTAEKGTMADIAADLAAEDIVTKPDAVKVAIGSSAAKPADTKPVAPLKESVASPAKSDAKTVSAQPDVKPPAQPDAAAANTSRHGRGPGSGRLGKVLLVLMLLIALIGAGYFGWMWYRERAQVAGLNSQVSDLQSSTVNLTSQLADAKASPTVTPATTTNSTLRLIPEIGLTYKLTDAAKKITYAYSESTDSAGSVHSLVQFDSTDLIAAERKVVSDPKKYTCTADDGPLGTLTSYKATDTIPAGGKASALKVDNKTSFKFGETYYVYAFAQSTCSADKTIQAAQTAGKTIVADLLTSLALSK